MRGYDVLLPCEAPKGADSKMLKWIRNQGSYVELNDPEIKNGDFSIILRNLSLSDNGTYKCYLGNEKMLQLINLIVTDSGMWS